MSWNHVLVLTRCVHDTWPRGGGAGGSTNLASPETLLALVTNPIQDMEAQLFPRIGVVRSTKSVKPILLVELFLLTERSTWTLGLRCTRDVAQLGGTAAPLMHRV